MQSTGAGLAWGGRYGCSSMDCLTGAVRFATFQPAQPLQQGVRYYLDFAPSGAVGVRDLAGNPADLSNTGGRSLPTPD
jgi:hypothetical protein